MSGEEDEILLEPFEPDDAERLCAWIDSPRALLEWTGPGIAYPLTPPQLQTLHAESADRQRVFRVRARRTGEVVGHGELQRIDRAHASARLARILIGPPQLRGQGLGRTLVAALLRVAFGELGLERVELEVLEDNAPALRCYHSLGFVREGVRRAALVLGGERRSSILMSMLRSEAPGAGETVCIAKSAQELAACFEVMQELRPHLERAEFLRRIRLQQEAHYALAFVRERGEVHAVAGFRVLHNLFSGRVLYVDDLVTTAARRSRGHGARLMRWLIDHARTLGCDSLELDSGVQRFDAHRFYLRQRMDIVSHHFRLALRENAR